MALLWFDGFESKLWNDYEYTGGDPDHGPLISSASPRNGDFCLGYDGSQASMERAIAPSGDLIFGVGMKSTGAVVGYPLTFRSGTTDLLTVGYNRVTGEVFAYKGSPAGTLLGTATLSFQPSTSTWIYVEGLVHFDSSVGTLKLWVDDVLLLDLSALNLGAVNPDNIVVGKFHDNVGIYLDDLYIADTSGTGVTSKLGSGVAIHPLRPSAAGSSTDWVPNAGANWECVDDTTPDGDASYVRSPGVGSKDLYNVTDLPSLTGTIKGVMVGFTGKKTDVGPANVKNVVSVGGTEVKGSQKALTSEYQGYSDLFLVDPNTGVDWTVVGVNSMQIGFEEV